MNPMQALRNGGIEMRTPRQEGFSLVEMLVAVVITVIVAGAIYGLLANSETGFRREPERTARQQNIREAMDQIMRDIANAGSGMPPLATVFTPGLYSCTTCLDGGSPMGRNGHIADELEIMTNDSQRENEQVCGYTPANSNNAAGVTNLFLIRGSAPVVSLPSYPVVLLFQDGTWSPRYVVSYAVGGGPPPGTAGTTCPGANHVSLTMGTAGDSTHLNTANLCGASGNAALGNNAGANCTVDQIGFAEPVRYRIRLEPVTNDPLLERIAPSNPANPLGYPENPQLVARGIEDMQVQYTQQNGTVSGSIIQPNGTVVGAFGGAPAVNFLGGDYSTIVTQVQVTLWARSTLPGKIQGQTTDANLGAALRGQLVATASPRSALISLEQQPNLTPTKWQ
jgi:prepilin-type N-terminal cleavage/methylation domain-containing protein